MKTKLLVVSICFYSIYFAKAQDTIPSIWYGDTILYIHPTENATDGIVWGGYGTDITSGNGATSTNGALNTSAIVAQLGDNGGVQYAAKLCDTLTAFGYTDWYLPSKHELYAMYEKKDSLNLFYYAYWSSFEYNSTLACGIIFFTSEVEGFSKNDGLVCRCIRREYPTSVLNAVQENSEIVIYPNLSNKNINISITGVKEDSELSIYNIQGNRILNREIKGKKEYSETIDVSSYSKGTYIVEIKNSGFVKTEKFIVE